ncbi:hypothetical protein H0H81_008761 [Sphagnurus paluster]|uniref:HMG box domain-containing protein n=1 Tax=Sphagnurus paluster TaxID=117069 RepID=A0A9P7KI91_9AGAR|nr:hypothetical protein H0H81_008761 [Sphagnurus paluster]
MAKTATVTKTKTATKEANDKKTRKPKADKADKPKREPTAYQLFCKANMKKWNDANPGRAKEAMGEMARQWKDAPENPNRGAEPRARKPKEPKAKAAPKKAAATKKAAPKKKAKKDESEDEEADEEEETGKKGSSDPMEGEDDAGDESD